MKRTVQVTMTVEVETDDSRFDETFMREFRESFYDFTTINEHVTHLAQLQARGLIGFNDFIEGYGSAKEMGISFGKDQVIDMEIVKP